MRRTRKEEEQNAHFPHSELLLQNGILSFNFPAQMYNSESRKYEHVRWFCKEVCANKGRVHFFLKKRSVREKFDTGKWFRNVFYARFFWGGNSQSRTALGNNCSKSAKFVLKRHELYPSPPTLLLLRQPGRRSNSKNHRISQSMQKYQKKFNIKSANFPPRFLLCMPSPPWAWSPASSCCSSPPSGPRQLGSPSQ